VADGDYSSIPVAGQKVLRNLARYLEFFCGMSNFLIISVTVSFVTHNTVLWIHSWERVGYRMRPGVIFMCL
jgi:hypothetical protein